MTDPREALARIRAQADAATEGPWEASMDRVEHTGDSEYAVAYDVAREEDVEFIAHARTDVPALVEALRAVLNLHFKAQPIPAAFGTQEGGDYCVTCAEDWPCPTVETIHQHLGEDA